MAKPRKSLFTPKIVKELAQRQKSQTAGQFLPVEKAATVKSALKKIKRQQGS